MNVFIRADGGAEIGYGHLVRTSALSEALLEKGHAVTVATTTPEEARDIYPSDCSVVMIASRNDPDEFLERIDTRRPDIVVTDAYPIDTDYERTVREEFPLVVIQDDARHAVCADVLINGNLYAADLRYDFIRDDPHLCLGPEYLLLRDEITQYAKRDPPWRDQPERAIVTMGGSDMAELTPTILRAFDGVDIAVDAIVGPGFSERQRREIEEVASTIRAPVDVVGDPANLIDRMFYADFAVCTASTTTYELLALGTPIVAIPVVQNQKPIASTLRERNLATVVKAGSDVSTLGRAIQQYLSDPDLRGERRNSGQKIVDGKGAARIADVITRVEQKLSN